MRCGCPPTDPKAAAAGAPASLEYCGERMRAMVEGSGSTFSMQCPAGGDGGGGDGEGGSTSGGGGDGGGGGKCQLSIDGVPFTIPLACSPNECRTAAAASVVAAALSSGGPPPPPPVQDWVPVVAGRWECRLSGWRFACVACIVPVDVPVR
jgi:hypothetical protein